MHSLTEQWMHACMESRCINNLTMDACIESFSVDFFKIYLFHYFIIFVYFIYCYYILLLYIIV